jgi:hypothetical protein
VCGGSSPRPVPRGRVTSTEAIMAQTTIARLNLGPTGGTATTTVSLDPFRPLPFTAWGSITKVDPLHAVNGIDFAALDIQLVDGLPTLIVEQLPGGVDPLHVGSVSGLAKNITVRLRSNLFEGGRNLSCAAEFVVLTGL